MSSNPPSPLCGQVGEWVPPGGRLTLASAVPVDRRRKATAPPRSARGCPIKQNHTGRYPKTFSGKERTRFNHRGFWRALQRPRSSIQQAPEGGEGASAFTLSPMWITMSWLTVSPSTVIEPHSVLWLSCCMAGSHRLLLAASFRETEELCSKSPPVRPPQGLPAQRVRSAHLDRNPAQRHYLPV